MTKVAIKNENITSSGGIYHIIDVFSKLGFERQGWKATDRSGNDFRQARKCQTFREMTFAMRGNAKPFGKRLSPSAEMPNHSGNDFRQARKYQTMHFFLVSSVSMCSKPSFYSIVLVFNEWSNDISLCIWIRYGGVIIPI